MRASDFRIGNWVYEIIESRVVKIDGIEPSHDEVWLNYANGSAQYIRYICNIQPILLSEGVLLKAGFVKDDFSTTYVRYSIGNFNIINDTDKNTFICDGIKYTLVYIEYLHQLQNIFYYLIKKELEISWT